MQKDIFVLPVGAITPSRAAITDNVHDSRADFGSGVLRVDEGASPAQGHVAARTRGVAGMTEVTLIPARRHEPIAPSSTLAVRSGWPAGSQVCKCRLLFSSGIIMYVDA